MAIGGSFFMRVEMEVLDWEYDWILFEWRSYPINQNVTNPDGQRTYVTNGTEVIYNEVQYGRLTEIKNTFRVFTGFPPTGGTLSAVPQIETYDLKEDAGYYAVITERGTTWQMPFIEASNFSMVSNNQLTSTSRQVNFSGLLPYNDEFVGYESPDGTQYLWGTMEVFGRGYFIQRGMIPNWKYDRQVVYLARQDRPANKRFIRTIPIWAKYEWVVFGFLNANYDANVIGKVIVNWGKWSKLGNLDFKFRIVLRNTAVSPVQTYDIDATKDGTYIITDAPVGADLRVRILGQAKWHDGVANITENTPEVPLGLQTNYSVKIQGTFRNGINSHTKINGVWRKNAGNLRTRVNGIWR